MSTVFNPFGFRGSVWAPVSTNLGNARWLASWLSREPDFTAEEVGIYGIDSVYIHDRAQVDAMVAGPDLEIGADAMVDGDLFTERFFIRDRGSFTGTLQHYTGQFQNMIGDIGLSGAHGPTSNIFIGTYSDRPIHLQGADQNSSIQDFQATIVAPNAKVEVHNFYDFEGQIIAKDIEIHQDVEFTYREFGGEFCSL